MKGMGIMSNIIKTIGKGIGKVSVQQHIIQLQLLAQLSVRFGKQQAIEV